MDSLSIILSITSITWYLVLQYGNQVFAQLRTHPLRQCQPLVLQVLLKEWDHDEASAMNCETLDGAVDTLVVIPHDKQPVRSLYRSQKDLTTWVPTCARILVASSRVSYSHKHVNPHGTQHRGASCLLTEPSIHWPSLARRILGLG